MTRAMNTLVLTRAHYRRRYGNDAPEMSIPSRFLEEVPSQLVENLGGRTPAWAGSGYGGQVGGYGSRASGYGSARRPSQFSEFADQHYNYEDESQEAAGLSATKGSKSAPAKPFVASWMVAKPKPAAPSPTSRAGAEAEEKPAPEAPSIDNIAHFFGGKTGIPKPGALSRPAARPSMDIPAPSGAANLKKGQRVRHSKYGEGTVLMREGEGEDAKLTVMFTRHGMKKLMEKFANLTKI
jgi:DNA helicase-2/ATP-dependent DNA helicase PcrA